ncbi:MAG: hypothetical protein WB868_21520 [Xanthobacteraceae bacterium]
MDMEAARAVARETVTEMFLALGVDMKADGEAVRVQQDFAFMRSLRLGMRHVRYAAYTALITVAMSGAGALIWSAFTAAAKAKAHGG